MKCPKCGSPIARYVVSRKGLWKGKIGGEHGRHEPRKDFKIECSKCGYKGENKE